MLCCENVGVFTLQWVSAQWTPLCWSVEICWRTPFHSWKHRAVFCERDHFWMRIYTGCGKRPRVRYLVTFWKHKIPKLCPVAAGFIIVSFFRKIESAAFKKGQKSETGRAEAEETEVLLQSERSQSGPLLKAFWSMFGTYFLLGTVCLVICDVFMFSIPKLLRYAFPD